MSETTESPRSRRRGLGRGLDALLGGPLPGVNLPTAGDQLTDSGAIDPDAPALLEIDPRRIRPNPEQPRTHFDPGALDLLAESIRVHGVLHPVVVERSADGGFQLVAGERRWRASQLAGVSAIPAIVRPAAESARHALELALTENLVRADLSAMEEAAAYSRLADTFGLTHDAIALRVGRSRPQVSNTIRLLNLPADVQEAVAEGRLAAGHARALLALPDSAAQLEMATQIADRDLSVREVERAVAARNAPPAAAKPRAVAAAEAEADEPLRRGFEAALGTPVHIIRKGEGGRLVIEFFGDEDLHALYERMGGPVL